MLRQAYDLRRALRYSPLLMNGSQYKAAFVIKFQAETDIEAGRFEGRVQHIPSYNAARFHSLDELLRFIAKVLRDVREAEHP